MYDLENNLHSRIRWSRVYILYGFWSCIKLANNSINDCFKLKTRLTIIHKLLRDES
jgi:hypothetical protein